MELLREVDLASFLGAARSKTHVRGRLTPTCRPSGEFRAAGSLLRILARYFLTVRALVEG